MHKAIHNNNKEACNLHTVETKIPCSLQPVLLQQAIKVKKFLALLSHSPLPTSFDTPCLPIELSGISLTADIYCIPEMVNSFQFWYNLLLKTETGKMLDSNISLY